MPRFDFDHCVGADLTGAIGQGLENIFARAVPHFSDVDLFEDFVPCLRTQALFCHENLSSMGGIPRGGLAGCGGCISNDKGVMRALAAA